jgi:hypothetical protein
MTLREILKSKWPGRVLLAIVLITIGYTLGKNLLSLNTEDFQLHPAVLLLSLVFAILSHLVHFLNWILVTLTFGIQRPLISSGKAYFVSRLGRYVPGKVTLLIMRFNEYKMYSRRAVIMAMSVDYISSLAAAGLVVLIGVFAAHGLLPEYIRHASLISSIVFLLALYPPFLRRLSNWVLTLLKRPTFEILPTYPKMLFFVGLKVCAALLQGITFFLLLRGLAPVEIRYYLVTTGVYYAAGLIGIAALFAPQGLGVTEGVLYLVLSTFLPKPAVVVAALLIRVIVSLTELLLAAVFSILDRQSSRRNSISPCALSNEESENAAKRTGLL